jgi:hypothetical protein
LSKHVAPADKVPNASSGPGVRLAYLEVCKLESVHANKSVTDDYSKVKEDETYRKQVAEQVGIGFELPASDTDVAPNCTQSELLARTA